MPYDGAFQTTILGRTIRFVSREKLLKYPDELELPDEYKPQAVPGGGEKRERWRSPENSDRRWRGSRSMSRRPSQLQSTESRGIDRSSTDDTVVEEEDGPTREVESGRTGEKGRDPNLVDWYGEDDQENPYVDSYPQLDELKVQIQLADRIQSFRSSPNGSPHLLSLCGISNLHCWYLRARFNHVGIRRFNDYRSCRINGFRAWIWIFTDVVGSSFRVS